LNFIFARLSFGLNMKGYRKPYLSGQPREAGKAPISDLEWQLAATLNQFSFFIIIAN